MKKALQVLAAAGILTCSFAMGAGAAGLDDYYDYIVEEDAYNYYFTQGVMVTMPGEWYRNTFVKAEETAATFYHKDSYEKYEAEGIENGGKLFTISYSVNQDFKDLEGMEYIGFDEEECLNYFVLKPTDYCAYASDAAVKAEYDTLWAGVDDVIDSIRLVNEAGGENTEDTVSSALFEKAGNELFSFEIPAGWTSRTDGDAVLAVKDEGEEVPYLKVWKLTPSGTAGEEVVKWKNEFMDTYQNRLAGELEVFTYEVEGTDRAAAGIRALVSSIDGMDTITCIRAIENLDGQYFAYECAYISSTYAKDRYEDETTYFEYLHAMDTMEVDL